MSVFQLNVVAPDELISDVLNIAINVIIKSLKLGHYKGGRTFHQLAISPNVHEDLTSQPQTDLT